MHAKALTVHWHLDNQPIYSAHFQPGKHSIARLATAGGDNNVRTWRLETETKKTESGSYTEVSNVTYLSTLTRHTQAVNVVRFDPKGHVLASAGDDGTILLWTLSDTVQKEFGNEDSSYDKESWKLRHSCHMSSSEVYDLAWSPDSQYILAGSMDNVARIYNASNGQCIRQLAEHQHYVQGVSWDPLNEYIATQSSDRSVHIYTLKTKNGQFSLSTPHKIAKADLHSFAPKRRGSDTSNSGSATAAVSSTPGTPRSMNPPLSKTHSRKSSFSNRAESPSPSLPLPAVRSIGSPSMAPSIIPLPTPPLASISNNGVPPSNIQITNSSLYHNETFTSFFRRLCFTPDGSLLLTPSGIFKYNGAESEEITNTVYIYTRAGLNRPPVAHLPGLKKPSLAVKCSPILYKLREEDRAKPTEHFDLELSAASQAVSTEALTTDSSTPEMNSPVFKLNYRIIYAVATQDSVIIYDTEQKTPLCIASNLHYATFTDLTWSPDGNTLLMSSTDGFCSVITFEPGELGERYTEVLPTLSSPALSNTGLSALSPPITTVPLSSTTSISSAHASPIAPHAELWSSPVSTPASSTFSTDIPVGPALIPIVSNVPPLATHGGSLSSPPSTPLHYVSPKRPEEAQEPTEKKKRRIAPTLVKPE